MTGAELAVAFIAWGTLVVLALLLIDLARAARADVRAEIAHRTRRRPVRRTPED